MRISFLTLALAVVGTVYFVAFTEEDRKWKALMVAMTAASLVLQFAVPVHFVIPLILQTLVAIWTVVYWKLDQ